VIILDTHIWLWWVNGNTAALGEKRKEMVDAADEAVVSAISCFEVAWLEHHNRISLPVSKEKWLEDWV